MAGISFDIHGGAPKRARLLALVLAAIVAFAVTLAAAGPSTAQGAQAKRLTPAQKAKRAQARAKAKRAAQEAKAKAKVEAQVAKAKAKVEARKQRRVLKKWRARAKKSARKAQCGVPDTLYAGSDPASAYTMILRVNTLNDVKTYTSADETKGGLQPRIHQQDIFLINTRFAANDGDTEQQIASQLRATFPCNRIFSLNGVSVNSTSQSYLFSLVNAPEVDAYLVDWEKMDWDQARSAEPGLPAWVDSFTPMLTRLNSRLGALRAALPSNKPFGIVPFFRTDWDFGQIERVVQRQNSLVAPNRQGFQSVQTQKSCQTGGPAGLGGQIKTLFTQYKRANFKPKKKKKKGAKSSKKGKAKRIKPKLIRNNLGVQISFTATPDPSSSDPVKSVPVSTAAACTIQAINSTSSAVLYWARPSDVKALLADPNICPLRPSPSGTC
jgi:hypothetical protein